LGWTQDEISKKLKAIWPDAKGTAQKSISESLVEMQKSPFPLKTDLEKGHAPAELAKRYALPEILVWTVALEGLTDAERLEKLGIKIQPYDVWNFAKCHDLFGCKHPGRIPGELVAHVPLDAEGKLGGMLAVLPKPKFDKPISGSLRGTTETLPPGLTKKESHQAQTRRTLSRNGDGLWPVDTVCPRRNQPH
jgi:hypothetical protein